MPSRRGTADLRVPGPVGRAGPADGDAGVHQPAAAVPIGRGRLLPDHVSVRFFPTHIPHGNTDPKSVHFITLLLPPL